MSAGIQPFKVSVIIPVYNAEKYLENAVNSALQCPETGEVLLIEDRSPDNSLALCQHLAAALDRVRLLQHPDKGNHGAGMSRNLGIVQANCSFIAFLDADDYYLPNRFTGCRLVFEQDTEKVIDGVYEAYGKRALNESGFGDYTRKYKKNLDQKGEIVLPAAHFEGSLFYNILARKITFWHTNSITFRKESLLSNELFFEDLPLHQDSLLWLKAAYYLNLVPGNITTPVTFRTYHGENRETRKNFQSIAAFEKRVFHWATGLSDLSFREKAWVIRRYATYNSKRKFYTSNPFLKYGELLWLYVQTFFNFPRS